MKPLVLLIPGTLNDATIWSDVVAGLGETIEPRIADVCAQASIPDMARDAWSLVGGADAGQPLLVAGFSLGGYVALEMLSAPQRPVHAVALVSTSARGEPEGNLPVRERAIRGFERQFERTVAGTVAYTTHAPSPDLVQRMEAMMLRVGPEAAIRQTRAVMTRREHHATAASLRMPVAVLCGTQDKVTPPELARELAQAIPGARLRLVEGAGHLLPAEQPGAVVTALRELLERVHHGPSKADNTGDER